MIPISKPSYLPWKEDIKLAVGRVIDSGNIANGKHVRQFEEQFSEYVGVKHAIAVSSGTSGLIASISAVRMVKIGENKFGDVIVPAFSFIATANAAWIAGKPKFTDVDTKTFNMTDSNLFELRKIRKNSIIIPVDIFGNPAKITRPPNSYVVIDACESLGSRIDRDFDIAVYAFYPNKQITTGEGGMICTNDDKLAQYCRRYINQGRDRDTTAQCARLIGYNFRMTEMQAVMGSIQLAHIDEIISSRREAMRKYIANGVPYAQKLTPETDNFSPFIFAVNVPDKVIRAISIMRSHDIDCRWYFPAIVSQPPYGEYLERKDCSCLNALHLGNSIMAIPFWSFMENEIIDKVSEVYHKMMEAVQ